MKVKDETLKCVVFLGVEAEGVFTPAGTGFILGVPYEMGEAKEHIYLVTAKHNIEPNRGNCNAFRVNTKDGKSRVVQFDPQQRWYDHSDAIADVCLCPIAIEEDWDVLVLPYGMITDKEMLGNDDWITNGSDIFITGLFADTPGATKNRPIVRKGSIAMIPAEKITTEFGVKEVYLIEARSVGGLSGSPVFWYATSDDLDMGKVFELRGIKSPSRIKPAIRQEFWGLLGLIQGHFPTNDNEEKEPSYDRKKDKKKGIINAGIAAVTPAIKVSDILAGDELRTERAGIEKGISPQ